MFTVKLADMIIRIENKYEYIENMCKDYIVADNEPDFEVRVSDAEITYEGEQGEQGSFSRGYLESLAVYRRIAEWLPAYDGFLMHGVLFEVEGKGILLCARSGVGKSTHMALWKQLVGEKCRVINGDKPLIRIIDGKVYAYGTPWCGKEGIQLNDRTMLTDVCFIERNETNITEEYADSDMIMRLFKQIYLPKADGEQKLKVLDLTGKLIESAKFWKIRCNKELEAAEVAYKAIFDK